MAAPVGWALSRHARRLEQPGLVGLAGACLLACCALPLLWLGAELLTSQAPAALAATLGRAAPWLLLLKSLGLALIVTLGALVIGVAMGTLLARSDLPLRRTLLWLHLFPLFLPPFVLALGWFHLLGQQGLFGSPWSSRMLFGPAGVIAILVLVLTPAVSALTALGLWGIDPALEEAARIASPPLRVLRRILLPLAAPAIALGALVTFALALSEIGVPMFLGVRTYPAAVFTRVGGMHFAPGEALALTLPLFAVGLLLIALERRLVGRRSYAALGMRSGRASPLPLGRARVAASIAAWLVVIVGLLPLAGLLLQAGPQGLSDAASWTGSSVEASVVSGIGAASATMLLAVLLGHALARARPLAPTLDAVSLLSFLTPASVLGVGLIAVWNRPGSQAVYGSVAILVLGLVARYAAVGMRAAAAVFSRSSPSYEEAAQCAGRGFARRMTRVVLPMHARALVGAWLLVLVLCLRDLDMVVVFYPAGLEPLSVRIFTLEANGPERVVAGLALYQTALIALGLAGGFTLLRVGQVSEP